MDPMHEGYFPDDGKDEGYFDEEYELDADEEFEERRLQILKKRGERPSN